MSSFSNTVVKGEDITPFGTLCKCNFRFFFCGNERAYQVEVIGVYCILFVFDKRVVAHNVYQFNLYYFKKLTVHSKYEICSLFSKAMSSIKIFHVHTQHEYLHSSIIKEKLPCLLSNYPAIHRIIRAEFECMRFIKQEGTTTTNNWNYFGSLKLQVDIKFRKVP